MIKKPKSKIVKIDEIAINEGQVKGLPKNPRFIKDEKFENLVRSVTSFPEMMSIRPIVVDENMVILGGNMRYRACKSAGMKTVPVLIAENLTIEQKKEFLIKDNVSGGDWDWESITADWGKDPLEEWGLDLEFVDPESEKDTEEIYTSKIKAPTYEPSDIKPSTNELYDVTRANALIDKIEASSIDKEVKRFLIASAQRHVVFDYRKIADFYAHSDKETQELMESSALVIIDFDKALENGFVKLSGDLREQYAEDYEDEIEL